MPGWGILIPFYNLFLFVKLAGKPGWWFVLMLVPVVNDQPHLRVRVWVQPARVHKGAHELRGV